MFKPRVNKFIKKFLSVFLLIWGAASFFVFPTLQFVQIAIITVAVACILLLFFGRGRYYIFIVTFFTNIYALYGILFTYGLSVWLVMLLLVAVVSLNFYLYLFLEFPSESTILYLVLFCVLNLELFLGLSYYLVNPMTRSLIMAVFAHLYYGFLTSIVEDKKIDFSNLSLYIYSVSAILLMIFFTISWGR